jgi:hypothetical protein
MSMARRVCIVVTLGVAYPVLVGWLHVYGWFIDQFSLAVAQQASPAFLRSTVFLASALSWALVVGMLFGVPLGLVVREHLFRFWALFVVAGAVTQFVWTLSTRFDPQIFVAEWSLPDLWLNLVAILVFASLVLLLRRRRAPSAPIAP